MKRSQFLAMLALLASLHVANAVRFFLVTTRLERIEAAAVTSK